MKIVIIDSFALIHRVYHALPNFTTSSGEPSGAVYGFCSTFLKVLQKFNPDHVCAAFDDGSKPTFRKELAPLYHANRPEKDASMIAQIEVIKDFLRAMNIPIYIAPGFEGDDVIGTLAYRFSSQENAEIIILTGDYDTLQLVNKTTCVFTMRKGITDTILFDENAVHEKYGFDPEFLPDYKALMGDPSDNYGGVPGIGPKTAQMLIMRFKTVENVYAYLTESEEGQALGDVLPASLEIKLKAGKEDAFLSKKLAVIRKDVPLDIDLTSENYPVGVTQAARDFFEQMGFSSLLKRVDSGNGKDHPMKKKIVKSSKPALRLFD